MTSKMSASEALGVLKRHVKDLSEGIRYGESIVDMEAAADTFAALSEPAP